MTIPAFVLGVMALVIASSAIIYSLVKIEQEGKKVEAFRRRVIERIEREIQEEEQRQIAKAKAELEEQNRRSRQQTENPQQLSKKAAGGK